MPQTVGRIRAALRVGDSKALEHAAHALKGSVGNFAMPGPWETAQRLELLAKSGQLSGAEETFRILEQQIAHFNQVLARHAKNPPTSPAEQILIPRTFRKNCRLVPARVCSVSKHEIPRVIPHGVPRFFFPVPRPWDGRGT